MSTRLLSITLAVRPHFSHVVRSRRCSGFIPKCFRDDGELLFENDLRLVGDGAVLPLRAWVCPEIDVVDP